MCGKYMKMYENVHEMYRIYVKYEGNMRKICCFLQAYSCNLDFSPDSKLKNFIYVGFMDSICRMWRFDANTHKLELVKEMQGHLDSIKNIALKGDLGYISTSARVILSNF